MIRAVDGFDLCDFTESPLKYNRFTVSTGIGNTFAGSMVAGRGGGRAIQIETTGFGVASLTNLYDQQDVWGFHLDFRVNSGGGTIGIPAQEWFRLSNSAGIVLSIRIGTDGKLSLYKQGTTLIGTSTTALVMDRWYTIELKAHFPTGQQELRIDQQTEVQGPVTYTVPRPDRVTLRWEHLGLPYINWDNYVVWDGQGSLYTDFLGPVQVTSLQVTGDDASSGSWAPSSGSTLYQMINDATGRAGGSPDGDFTYIAGAGLQYFTPALSQCFGRNFALAINCATRPTSGSPQITLKGQTGAAVSDFGSFTVNPIGQWNPYAPAHLNDYFVYQGLLESAPGGDVWIDSDISNGVWGVEALANGVRVTALYLEKITSLLPLPFSCGSGSYSW